MTFELKKASDWGYSETVEINTIEDLKALSEKYTEELKHNFMRLILDFGDTGEFPASKYKREPNITIYDYWVE